MSDGVGQAPVRAWDADRPVLAGLLARREELLASFVDLRDGRAHFTTQPPSDDGRPEQTRTEFAALAALAALPQQVVEPFDLGALLGEQLTDTEQVLGALRDEAVTFDVPVHTRTQPLVRIEMPVEGIGVRLLVQVRRDPLRAVIVMPFTDADGVHSKTRLGWTTGHVSRRTVS